MTVEKYGLYLKDREHKTKYLEILRKLQRLPFTMEEITESIKLLCKYLSDDWLTVYLGIYQGGGVSVMIGTGKYFSFDFLYDIVPLGHYLKILEGMDNFDRLTKKLTTISHERISALIEISTAAKYKLAGVLLGFSRSQNKTRRMGLHRM